MKKSKLITCLSAAFVSAMALMSCSSLIKSKSGVILTIDGVDYTAEDLFNDQKTPAAAEAKFNAVYKVAIRAYFKNHTEDESEIKRNTQIKINEQKATAQSNADKNGTSYDEEWKKILDSNGVEDETGLYNKFEYELQKEKFENKLYENNYDVLRTGGKLHDKDGKIPEGTDDVPGYLAEKMPYHMKHILVKVGAAAGDNTTGTITAAESEKLYKVIRDLANGANFDAVSNDYSDDKTAAESHASLGIMSRDTSFVDDFKLGTYFYEAEYGYSTSISGGDYQASKAKEKLFSTGSMAATWEEDITKLIDPTSGEAIGVIPYEAAEKLALRADGGYADVEYDQIPSLKAAGVKKEDFKDKYLPRNVIFNKYFNKHNIMIIAPAKLPTYSTLVGDYFSADGTKRLKEDNYTCTYDTSTSAYPNKEGFKRAPKNNDYVIATEAGTNFKGATSSDVGQYATTQHILRDENGRTIFVFRSGTGGSSNDDYQGIHFVVIERSPFIGKEFDDNNTSGQHYTELKEYYTEYYPGQPGGHHPEYTDVTTGDKNKHTFPNYIMLDPELKNKKDRADTVKSELKKCTSDLNTYIYDYLLKDNKIQFKDSDQAKAIQKSITDWIGINREDAKIEKEHNWDNNWQTYYYSLAAKYDERKEYKVSANHIISRLVPEACTAALYSSGTDISNFIKGAFGVGGIFHE
ncbi:MAG: hypothetical protein MJ214_01050 [Bacilli bacterium]|nr:hypothetical protein [Bacilli bacterium]